MPEQDYDYSQTSPCEGCPFVKATPLSGETAGNLMAFLQSIDNGTFSYGCKSREAGHCVGATMMLLRSDYEAKENDGDEPGFWQCSHIAAPLEAAEIDEAWIEGRRRAAADGGIHSLDSLIEAYVERYRAPDFNHEVMRGILAKWRSVMWMASRLRHIEANPRDMTATRIPMGYNVKHINGFMFAFAMGPRKDGNLWLHATCMREERPPTARDLAIVRVFLGRDCYEIAPSPIARAKKLVIADNAEAVDKAVKKVAGRPPIDLLQESRTHHFWARFDGVPVTQEMLEANKK